MSVRGINAWAYEDPHDIALAAMIEQADLMGVPEWLAPELDHWRAWASIGDVALEIPGDWDESRYDFLQHVVQGTMEVVSKHGDYKSADLHDWSVLDGQYVSCGSLGKDVLPVNCVLDVLLGISEMLAGTLPPTEKGGGNGCSVCPGEGWR